MSITAELPWSSAPARAAFKPQEPGRRRKEETTHLPMEGGVRSAAAARALRRFVLAALLAMLRTALAPQCVSRTSRARDSLVGRSLPFFGISCHCWRLSKPVLMRRMCCYLIFFVRNLVGVPFLLCHRIWCIVTAGESAIPQVKLLVLPTLPHAHPVPRLGHMFLIQVRGEAEECVWIWHPSTGLSAAVQLKKANPRQGGFGFVLPPTNTGWRKRSKTHLRRVMPPEKR
jgi:hypothetical protein